MAANFEKLQERWDTLHHVLACASHQSGQENNRLGCYSARGLGHLSDRLAENTVRVIGIRSTAKRGQKPAWSAASGADLSVHRKWLGPETPSAAVVDLYRHPGEGG
jgi:hypothetical protein